MVSGNTPPAMRDKQIVNNSLCIAHDHLARSVPSQTARRFPFVSIRRLIAVSNAT